MVLIVISFIDDLATCCLVESLVISPVHRVGVLFIGHNRRTLLDCGVRTVVGPCQMTRVVHHVLAWLQGTHVNHLVHLVVQLLFFLSLGRLYGVKSPVLGPRAEPIMDLFVLLSIQFAD